MLSSLVLVAVLAAPADLAKDVQTGLALLKEGKYKEAIETFQKLQEEDPKNPIHSYNIACAYSLMGEKGKAVEWLGKSVDLGYMDRAHTEADDDLEAIRDTDGYKKALAGMDELLLKRYEETIVKAKEELAKNYEKPDGLFAFDFSLTGIDGKPLKLSDLKGKVVLCDIWGTWCPPCRMYIPHLIKLQETYGSKGFAVVGLNFERPQGDAAVALVKTFIEENKISYRCAIGERELLKLVPGFRGFPTSLIIDGQGKVRLVEVGYKPYPVVEAIVKEALARNKPRERF
ncbi:MAG: redoxin family protein [Planctomycetes bacterium]|nr:redoxin family protein [Planctomycetota bacterium]